MNGACPGCGQLEPEVRPCLNVSQRFLAHNGHSASLTDTEAGLMWALIGSMGVPVPMDEEHAASLSDKIADLSLSLQCVYGRGYILHDDARATDAGS